LDFFELIKVVGAFLGALLLALGLNVASGVVFSHPELAKPGYDIPVSPKAAPAASSAGNPASRGAD